MTIFASVYVTLLINNIGSPSSIGNFPWISFGQEIALISSSEYFGIKLHFNLNNSNKDLLFKSSNLKSISETNSELI